jgi:glutamyl-tRNA reductase
MDQQFKAIGLSFKNTSLEVREQLTMNESSSKRLMTYMKDFNCAELLVISTCNRTEFYYSADEEAEKALLSGISLITSIPKDTLESYFISYNDDEAVTHLFQVSLGLEAQVVGDLQIINQVKNAYQWSADEGMAGPYMHRLMHTIFFTNKKVVQETSFRDGAASVSYAAKELVEDLSKEIAAPKILLLGLGEIGTDVARNLSGTAKAEIFLSNRTRSKAEEIARECNFQIVDWKDFPSMLKQVDVIVSSVAAPQPLVTKELLADTEILSHKFFIDLSVPRSIANDLEEIPGAILYNIDEIRNRTSETLKKRIEAVPQVEKIVAEAIEDFNNWSKEMIVSPTIKKLKDALEQIRKEEMARYIKNADEKEAKIMDKLSKSMMQKIMKLPVLQLKAACKRGEANQLIDLLHDLFDLEVKAPKK